MAFYSIDVYPGDGATKTFALTFEFISRDSVFVYSVDDTTKAETALTVVTSGNPSSGQYKWDSDKQITLGDALPTGTSVKIQRDTTIDLQIVQWKDGSYIIAEDLNTSDKQWLYNLQELEDHIDQLNGSSSGPAVKKITGTAPVEVDSTNAQEPDISVDETVSTDNPNALTSDTRLMSEKAIDGAFSQAVGASGVYPPAGVTGKVGKLRIDDTGAEPKQFYWNGTAWVQIPTKGDKGDQGIQGPAGPPPGIQSPSATATNVPLQVGNILGQATASVSADSSGDLKFDFGIPVGQTGPKGDTGAGVNYLGEINATTAPAPGSPSNGDFYVNNTAGTSSWPGLGTVKVNTRLVYNANDSQWDSYDPVPDGFWLASSGNVYPATSTNNVLVGGTLPGKPNIELKASDGSAQFKSSLTTYDANSNISGDGGIGLFSGDTYYAGGTISVYKDTDAEKKDGYPNNAFEVFSRKDSTTDAMTRKALIHANGSAGFLGDIGIGDTFATPKIELKATGAANFANSQLQIDTVGRLGINKTPGFYIDAIGSKSVSTTLCQLECSDSNSVYLRFANTANKTGYVGYDKDSLTFFTDNNFRAAIDGDGKLLVGTTFAIGSSNLQTKQNDGGYDKGLDLINDQDWGYGSAINWYARAQESGAPLVLTAQMRTQWEGRNAYSINFKCLRDDDVYERMIIGSRGDVKFIGNGTSEAPNITLNADGSASFTKAVNVANYFADTGGIQINENGVFIRSNDSYEKVFTVVSDGTAANNEVITFERDGTASFAGGGCTIAPEGSITTPTISFSPLGSYYSRVFNSGTCTAIGFTNGDLYLGGTLDGSFVNPQQPNIALNADDGSATFAGYLKTTSFFSSTRTQGTDGCFSGYLDSTQTSKIFADGSATFTGDVQSGGDPSSGANEGAVAKSIGQFRACRSGTASALFAGYLQGGSNPTSRIFADGSAEFAGNITAGNVTFNLEPDNPDNYTTTEEEYEVEVPVLRPDGPVTTDLVDGEPEQEMQTITRTREVKTYTGPTMDVKDTLLKITEALTQLKTAAASATTCEELRTAIDTALADV